MGTQKIKFVYHKNLILLPAKIYGKRRELQTNCIIDTGCAITTVKTSLIDMLGYSAIDGEKRSKALTASGDRQEGYTIKIKKFEINNLSFENLLVDAIDLPESTNNFRFDCLIGNNLLDKFCIKIDYKNELIAFKN